MAASLSNGGSIAEEKIPRCEQERARNRQEKARLKNLRDHYIGEKDKCYIPLCAQMITGLRGLYDYYPHRDPPPMAAAARGAAREIDVPKVRYGALPEYLIDWCNAIRFLWHVFTARLKSRNENDRYGRAANQFALQRSLAKDRN